MASRYGDPAYRLTLSGLEGRYVHHSNHLLAGHKWFIVNNFTSLIDVVFGTDYDFSHYHDLRFTLTGLGFIFCWWMVHYLSTREMWFNGMAMELFLLVQVLGYLSNYAFMTTNLYQPMIITVILFVSFRYYRHYLNHIRTLDPERSIYRVAQLQRPFVPKRALQLIQMTPLCYSFLLKIHPYMDEGTYVRVKYSLGMADALVYVGINMDLGLVVLSRIVGTLRMAYQELSLGNIAWMVRVNITGAYTVMLRDFGWKSIPSDQLHISWFLYWVMKVILITVMWGQTDPAVREFYPQYVAQELAGSFVAATATVYFLCLMTGMFMTFLATACTMSGDVIPKSNVLHSCFDTVQHIRWNCFPWKVPPYKQVTLTIHAILFGHIPLCGKMIQNVGQTARRTCPCHSQQWLRAFGGIGAIITYLIYSYAVIHYILIVAPTVSQCFAHSIEYTSTVWIGYNVLIAVMEIVTICVFQGLDSPTSRSNLERGTGLFRTTMTGVLAVCLTAVNLIVLHETIYVSPGMCFYKDIVHNCLQVSARAIFLFIAIRNSQECGIFKRLRTVDSLTFRKSGTNVASDGRRDEVCGLCYGKLADTAMRKLPVCGHTFHEQCFDPWPDLGHRCPVCRTVFTRTSVQTIPFPPPDSAETE